MLLLLVAILIVAVVLPGGAGAASQAARSRGVRAGLLVAGALAPLLCYGLYYASERTAHHDGLFDTSMNDGDIMLVFGAYLAFALVPVAGCAALVGRWLAGRAGRG